MAKGVKAGDAYIRMNIDNDDLSKSFRRSLADFAKVTRGATAAGAAIATAIGVVAVKAISEATQEFANFGDQIGKMAKRTGVASQELAGLSFAAEQSGTSISAVENGIRRMQRTIVDAGRGLTTATDALDMMGISLDELESKNPTQQFHMFADAIASIEDPTKKAAAAQMVFGRSGTELIPMLQGGAEALRAFNAQADALGLILTPEQVENAERVKDAWNEVATAIKASKIALGSEFAPALIEILDFTVKILVQWEAILIVIKNAARSVGTVASIVAEAGAAVLPGGRAAANAAQMATGTRAVDFAAAGFADSQQLPNAIVDGLNRYDKFQKARDDAARAIQEQELEQAKKTAKATEELNQKTDGTGGTFE